MSQVIWQDKKTQLSCIGWFMRSFNLSETFLATTNNSRVVFSSCAGSPSSGENENGRKSGKWATCDGTILGYLAS
jgi:hypothetical protein